jgi:hypothetical protein
MSPTRLLPSGIMIAQPVSFVSRISWCSAVLVASRCMRTRISNMLVRVCLTRSSTHTLLCYRNSMVSFHDFLCKCSKIPSLVDHLEQIRLYNSNFSDLHNCEEAYGSIQLICEAQNSRVKTANVFLATFPPPSLMPLTKCGTARNRPRVINSSASPVWNARQARGMLTLTVVPTRLRI